MRPINLKWGPNGDIYLIDWHDQNPCHQAAADAWDYERGRVYRIQLRGRTPAALPGFGKLTVIDLMSLVTTAADPWAKRTALRLVGERAPGSALSVAFFDGFVKAVAERSDDFSKELPAATAGLGRAVHPRVRLQTLGFWLDAAAKLAEDRPAARVAQVRALADFEGIKADRVVAHLAKLAEEDDSPAVRREVAAACVKLGARHDVSAVLRALMAHADDASDAMIPHFTWLAYEKVIARQPKTDQSARPRRRGAEVAGRAGAGERLRARPDRAEGDVSPRRVRQGR